MLGVVTAEKAVIAIIIPRHQSMALFTSPDLPARSVARYSRLAFTSMPVLVATGLYLSWRRDHPNEVSAPARANVLAKASPHRVCMCPRPEERSAGVPCRVRRISGM
ncbi:hypothetical protein ABZ479_38180 [Streptomyces sp. NPDC005722]